MLLTSTNSKRSTFTQVALPVSMLAALALLAGCGVKPGSENLPTPTPTGTSLASGGATSVYVVQLALASGGSLAILQFSATSNGSVSPTSTLTLPAMGSATVVVATDSSGQLYVLGTNPQGVSEVLVYASGASGTATPVRTILAGAANFANGGGGMAIDSSGSLYITTGTNFQGSILVYPASANGTAVPSRIITGALTQLYGATLIAVDKSGNIYIPAGNSNPPSAPTFDCLMFSSTANGNVAPSRTFSVSTGIPSSTLSANGIDTDAAGDVYLSGSLSVGFSNPLLVIMEVASGATGTVTPIKTITTSSYAGGVRVDAAGNMYTVGFVNTPILSPYVAAYSASSSGNISPATTITSPAWSAPSSGGSFSMAVK